MRLSAFSTALCATFHDYLVICFFLKVPVTLRMDEMNCFGGKKERGAGTKEMDGEKLEIPPSSSSSYIFGRWQAYFVAVATLSGQSTRVGKPLQSYTLGQRRSRLHKVPATM